MTKDNAARMRDWLASVGVRSALEDPIGPASEPTVAGLSTSPSVSRSLRSLLQSSGALPSVVQAEVREIEGVLRFESLVDDVRWLGEGADADFRATEDGVLTVPLHRIADGSTWVLIAQDEGRVIDLESMLVWPTLILPDAPVWPSVEPLLDAIAHDQELHRALVAERHPAWSLGDAFVAAVAACCARADDRAAALRAAMRGEPLPIVRAARDWLASWRTSERMRLVSLAETATEELIRDLVEIEYEEDDAVRASCVGELARTRERLDALHLLFEEVSDIDPGPLAALLASADAVGDRLVTITPPLPALERDVVMVRASIASPDRWWTRLVPEPRL